MIIYNHSYYGQIQLFYKYSKISFQENKKENKKHYLKNTENIRN